MKVTVVLRAIGKRVARVVLISYVLLLLAAYFLSDQLMFPYQESSYTANVFGLSVVQNPTSGERRAMRHWPVESGNEAVLFFHGNAEDLGHLDGLAFEFNRLGHHFISFDYRGYGLSTGQPSEGANYADAEFFFSQVVAMGFKPNQITLWGRSIGGGVATHLAVKTEVNTLVLESTFTSAFKTMVPFPLFPFDRFDNLNKVRQIQSPLLMFHGVDDQIVDVGHAHKLIEAATAPQKKLTLFKGTGHNNMWHMNRSQLLATYEAFKKQ